MSSLRTQSVFAVISLGQTTRLKLALWDVRNTAVPAGNGAYLGNEASCSQSKRHSHADLIGPGRF